MCAHSTSKIQVPFFYNLCESLSLQNFILIPRPPVLFDECRDKVDRHGGVGQLSCVQIQSNVLRTFERDLECRSSVQRCYVSLTLVI